jgi:hypothetical protein
VIDLLGDGYLQAHRWHRSKVNPDSAASARMILAQLQNRSIHHHCHWYHLALGIG